VALVISGVAAFAALGRGGLPEDCGEAPDVAHLKASVWTVPGLGWGLTREHLVYLGTLLAVPCFAALVWSNRLFTVIPDSVLDPMVESESGLVHLAGTLLGEMSTLPGVLLTVTGFFGFMYLFRESLKSTKIERERLWVVLVLMFFSMLFWSFFEQAGSSVNNFTDRNVDRVLEDRQITQNDVGQTMTFRVGAKDGDAAIADLPYLSQEQLGFMLGDAPMTITRLTDLRDAAGAEDAPVTARTVDWPVLKDQVGMGVASAEIPASPFQSANPIYIILLGLGFSSLWSFLGRRNIEPSTPFKFSLGLLQLGLGFVVLWYGAKTCDPRGMVGMSWLLLGYLLHTTGELCLSPVGLSMVTKLSPKRLVSTAMGAWFLATAFSSFLAAIIATFTGVSHSGGESVGIPVPIETVGIYGGVFGTIAVAAIAASVLSFGLSPMLTRWMHIGVEDTEAA
jgi:dipeptide/tripeptide permease